MGSSPTKKNSSIRVKKTIDYVHFSNIVPNNDNNKNNNNKVKDNESPITQMIYLTSERICISNQKGELKITSTNLKDIEINKSFPSPILSLIQLSSNEHLVTGHENKVINEWTLEDPNPINKFENGHTDRILSLAEFQEKNYLISSSSDKLIIVWNIETHQIIKKIDEHKGPVNMVIYLTKTIKRNFVSCSEDCTIKVWNKKLNCFNTLNNENYCNYLMEYDDNKIAASFINKEVKIWNIENNNVEVVHKFDENVCFIYVNNQNIIFNCYESGLVEMFMAKYEISIKKKKWHEGKITGFIAIPDKNQYYSCGYDKIFKVWEN